MVLPVFPLFYENKTLYGSVTFIENKFLITAAHCFFNDDPNSTLFPGNFYIGYKDKHVPLPEPLYRGFIPKKETHESPLPRESFAWLTKNKKINPMSNEPFNLNTLKGRMAEQLIQDLFSRNGYNVFNYGLERIHPFLSTMLRKNYHTTSKALRFMPDFVVQSTKTGDLFYLEVKFRANGNFAFDDKYKDYPYKNAWFVVVSPHKIQCMHYRRLSTGNAITSHTNHRLTSVRSFHITKDYIVEYEAYARQFFGAFIKEKSLEKKDSIIPKEIKNTE